MLLHRNITPKDRSLPKNSNDISLLCARKKKNYYSSDIVHCAQPSDADLYACGYGQVADECRIHSGTWAVSKNAFPSCRYTAATRRIRARTNARDRRCASNKAAYNKRKMSHVAITIPFMRRDETGTYPAWVAASKAHGMRQALCNERSSWFFTSHRWFCLVRKEIKFLKIEIYFKNNSANIDSHLWAVIR